MNIHKVPTGIIFTDNDKKLEWLIVGDYGKEKNIKANFLGLDKKIMGVEHSDVDMSEKCVVTISTQHGCSMNCKFCDVPKVGFYGNVSSENLLYQIQEALIYGIENKKFSNNHTKRLNIHYARMGEPAFNPWNVLEASEQLEHLIKKIGFSTDTIHPVVSTMMPRSAPQLENFLMSWCKYKNNRRGEAGLQLSINSTADYQRHYKMNNLSLSLSEISKIAEKLPKPIGRKYTLNFPVVEETILNEKVLSNLFDKENFIVKITPIHQTTAALKNNFNVGTSYVDYKVYEQFEKPLVENGWDVIVFIPSLEEDSSRITCGNALLSDLRKERE